MQPKFTRKKVVSFLRKALVAMCFGVTGTVSAQVLSTASGTGYGGDLSVNNTLPLNVSFVVQNTTGAAVALTDVSVQLGPFGAISFPGDALTTKLFVSTTSLSGTYDLSTAAWTQIATGSAVVPAAVTVTPVITGASFVLPAGAQYRFVIECTKGLRISGPFAGFPLPTPNSFTNGGLVLKVGDNKIGGLNVGWGGLSPSPTNEPTFFGGTVTFISTVPCAGTPAPGLTQSTATTACPTIPFTLSLQNPTTGSGVSYQWQVSTTGIGGSYTDIPGATAATYSTTLTVASCYRARVICASPGGGTGTSTPICVALTPASGCYCTPPAMDCTDDDEIIRVRFSTLDNPSTCGTGPPAGYSNFTALPAPTIYSGAANPITVDLNGIWSKGVGVWIDYNRNGAFEASEFTNIGSGPAATTSFTTNINIPASALSGTTRMRVRTRFGGVPYLPGEACTNPSGFGETEDYNVNIQPCVPVTFSSNPSSTSISCGSNASFSVTTNGSLPAYRWEYRPNATAAWQFVPSAAPYSGENTATLTLTNVSQAFDGFQYRATATGGCSGVDVSAAATLTVTALVPVVNPASATICLGTVQPLTLTNTLGNVDLLTEGFNTMLPAGWNVQNLSQPLGTTSWFQGNPTVFPAQSGPPNSYAGANFEATTTVGTISSWLITPQLSIKNGDVLTFWSRANDGTSQGGPFADRMEVRMSTAGASTNVGATATSFGDFSNL
ncbi:MAG TPA: choice-of-anchor J domain-containing protein, partial [Chitinophagaceae bacterium]|nr:choice-of-anchor J domain-containing protein [Chitinophagaceae bacterium]